VNGLVFLGAALLLSIIGSLLLWLRHRKPTSLHHGIDSFSKEMRALSPQRSQGQTERGR
jgi:hypothetical protein